jgi:hypothetical protein
MAGEEHSSRAAAVAERSGEEFLPLEVAATLAYERLTEIRRELPAEQLDELIHFAAIALSTIAPIYMTTSAGAGLLVLSFREIEELLDRPLKSGAPSPLHGLRIRKTDMESAIETLKLAKNAHGITNE